MRSGFFIKTAWNNIRKNYRFFVPQILTGMGLLGCFYIVLTLAMDGRLQEVKGGDYIPTFMIVGTAVIGLLSAILVLYTNSFLMRQRKREYGLYNVLGMEKKHIGRILFYEALISNTCSILLGLILGILFYKLSSLLICRLLHSDVVLGFYFISPKTLIPSALFFAFLYAFAFIVNRISLSRMNPVELMKSRNVGEKEPKVKWVLLILGVITLGTGYYISCAVKSPLGALILFFAAVFLVIIGTYFLFVSGSIFVLKCLKKNKKYYYQKRHMSSVAGLLYRMKQNAVGLASICILATGVLIMISSTVALYSGMQASLDDRYPQELYLNGQYQTYDGEKRDISVEDLTKIVTKAAEDNGLAIKEVEEQRYLEVSFLLLDGRLYMNDEEAADLVYSPDDIVSCYFVTEKLYQEMGGTALGLKDAEIAVADMATTMGVSSLIGDELELKDITFKVKQSLSSFPIKSNLVGVTTAFGIVVADEEMLQQINSLQQQGYQADASDITVRIGARFEDREAAFEKGKELNRSVSLNMDDVLKEDPEYDDEGYFYSLDTYWDTWSNVVGMYGALLFLGIILGLVCLFATALIIYYKQISEGYEDRERYQIMQKVGMSHQEVKRTIRTQILMVFFLPLVFAGIHTAFAFPILNRLMQVMMLASTRLYIICMLITYLIFTLVYILIYTRTAKTYYKIVN